MESLCHLYSLTRDTRWHFRSLTRSCAVRDSHFMEGTEDGRSGCAHSYGIARIVNRRWLSLFSHAHDTPFEFFADMFGGFRFDIAISSTAFERLSWRKFMAKSGKKRGNELSSNLQEGYPHAFWRSKGNTEKEQRRTFFFPLTSYGC